LIIDDGSEDGSAAIAAKYPVRYFRTVRQGVSAARNRGIRESRGDYLIFLDGDDRLRPGAVAASLAALEPDPECCLAVGGHNIISESGQLIRTRNKPCTPADCYAMLLRSNFIECTSSVILRRSKLPEKEWFREGLHGAEDYELFLRLARQHPVCCHEAVVSEYRQHPSNSSRNSQMMLRATLTVFREQRAFACTSLKRERSYLKGWWTWRRKYGRQLTVEMATRKPATGSPWMLLARTYPIGVMIVLIARSLPADTVRTLLLARRGGSPAMDKATQNKVIVIVESKVVGGASAGPQRAQSHR
jgi:glycosyltransferase involved in cell wall biosynthesis